MYARKKSLQTILIKVHLLIPTSFLKSYYVIIKIIFNLKFFYLITEIKFEIEKAIAPHLIGCRSMLSLN